MRLLRVDLLALGPREVVLVLQLGGAFGDLGLSLDAVVGFVAAVEITTRSDHVWRMIQSWEHILLLIPSLLAGKGEQTLSNASHFNAPYDSLVLMIRIQSRVKHKRACQVPNNLVLVRLRSLVVNYYS